MVKANSPVDACGGNTEHLFERDRLAPLVAHAVEEGHVARGVAVKKKDGVRV